MEINGNFMSEKYTKQLNVRLPQQIMYKIRLISMFEHLKITDLVRQWIYNNTGKYNRDPRFKRFLKQQHLTEKWRNNTPPKN